MLRSVAMPMVTGVLLVQFVEGGGDEAGDFEALRSAIGGQPAAL